MTARAYAACHTNRPHFRRLLRYGLAFLIGQLASVGPAIATIYTCDWQPIPDTEDVWAGINAQLDHLDLQNTCWRGVHLNGSTFEGSNLPSTLFAEAKLFDVNFRDANLTKARMAGAWVWRADFTGAKVTGADLSSLRGFTESMLKSTADYRARNLDGLILANNDMSGWDFSGQSMVGISLGGPTPAIITDANLRGADMTRGLFYNARAEGADFTGATFSRSNIWGMHIDRAILDDTTSRGLLFTHISSTATYRSGTLRGVSLRWNDLSNWSFSGKHLTDVNVSHSTMTNLDLSDAIISGVHFQDTTARGFTEKILQSTASYRSKKLEGLNLLANDLSGWDLHGQDLSDATFFAPGIAPARLDGTDLSGADLRGAALEGITGFSQTNMIWPDGRIEGLVLKAGAMLTIRDDDGVSTASPHGRPVPRAPLPIRIHDHALLGDGGTLRLEFDADPWDSLITFIPGIPVQLNGNLELTFSSGTKTFPMWGRKLRIFDWTGTSPEGRLTLTGPYRWDASSLYTTGEVTLLGLSLLGDVNYDNYITVRDIDLVAAAVRNSNQDPLYDLNRDGQVTSKDHRYWVEGIRKTWFGDANLDGEFDSRDLVVVFQAGLYEDAIPANASWARGDWNGDGDFNSSDLVSAFENGGYQKGPRASELTLPPPVPEPSAGLLWGIACLLGGPLRRRARRAFA
jgi:uncharacterized protein YjbI with pentapeptide repeats